MYHTEPPKDKTIREWYMNSSRVAACSFHSAQAASLGCCAVEFGNPGGTYE